MSTIKIDLEFAGVILPVAQDEQGRDVVPVKPIVELLKVDWMRQYRRMQTPYLARRLGVCIGLMPYAGQSREMVCIRLDRVSAYLNTINPDRVRGMGNEEAADFLERKHQEWDDVLHAYEQRKGIFSNDRSRRINEAAKVVAMVTKASREGNTALRSRLMEYIDASVDGALRIPKQLDLGDDQ